MRILALITARGGSKRVPQKNIRPLGGKPLLAWSIEAAKGIATICDILVSTDDPDVARSARDAGALVPWLRPAELATDTASSVDVCLHALDRYEAETGSVDGLLLLQPTSPFRSRKAVLDGIELFRGNDLRPVVGVSPADSHPLWCFRIEGNALLPFINGERDTRSQDLPPAYVVNGALYLISPERLRRLRTFFGEDAVPLLMDSPESRIDIDTQWDWAVAEAMLAAGTVGGTRGEGH